MGEYKDLYLKTNVLVLAYVFEIPVSAYLEYYGWDSCYYFSTPWLNWDARLKMA